MATELRQVWRTWQGAAWWPAALLVLVQTVNSMWYMPQLSFFPVYLQEQIGLPPAAIGGVVAGAQVAGMVAALLGGWITGRLESKWALVTGLIFAGLGSLAFQAHAIWLVAALAFASGVGLAWITVGGSSYLTRLSGRGAVGMLAAFYALSMTVGGTVGNPIAGMIIDRHSFSAFGWAETVLIAGGIALAVFGLTYLQDRSAGAMSAHAVWLSALPMARQPRVRRLLGMRSLPTIFYGMLTVLIPLLINTLSGSKVLVAAYGTTNLVVASAAQLLTGRAVDRWGARARRWSLTCASSSPVWAWQPPQKLCVGCLFLGCSAWRPLGRCPR